MGEQTDGFSDEDSVPGTKVPIWVALGIAEFIHAISVLRDDSFLVIRQDEDFKPTEISALGSLDEALSLMGYEADASEFGAEEQDFVNDLTLTIFWLETELHLVETEYVSSWGESQELEEEIESARLVHKSASPISRSVVTRDGLVEFSQRMDRVGLDLSYPVLAFFLQACMLQIHWFMKDCFHEFAPEQLESSGEPCSKCGLMIWDPKGFVDFFSNSHKGSDES